MTQKKDPATARTVRGYGYLMNVSYNIDFLSATVLNIHHKKSFLDYLVDIGIEFQPRKFALKGYSSAVSAWSDTIILAWNDAHERMGVHLQVSGKGLSYIEALGISVPQFTEELIARFQAKFSRLDVALTTDGVHVRDVLQLAATDNYRGNVKNVSYHGSLTNEGMTVYFGSRESETFMRVYNKAAEQKQDGVLTRFEWEFKGHKANALAPYVASSNFEKIIGICRNFIQFINRNDDSNITRCSEVGWWRDLMKYDRHKLAVNTIVSDVVTKTYSWIKTQVAPTLAALIECDMLSETLQTVLAEKHRFKDKHHALMQAISQMKEKPNLVGQNDLWQQMELIPHKKQNFRKNPGLVLTSRYCQI